MVFRIPGADEPPPSEWFLPPSDEVESLVSQALDGTSLFAARFREAAGRALLLPRRHPTRAPAALGAAQARGGSAGGRRAHPVVSDRARDVPRVSARRVRSARAGRDADATSRSGACASRTVDTAAPSPFAASLLFNFVGNFIYDGDAPLAERRAQALTIDHERLRELLGEAELRSLLDPEIIADHERFLQRLAYPAKDADGLCDVLRGARRSVARGARASARRAPLRRDAWVAAAGARAPRVSSANSA